MINKESAKVRGSRGLLVVAGDDNLGQESLSLWVPGVSFVHDLSPGKALGGGEGCPLRSPVSSLMVPMGPEYPGSIAGPRNSAEIWGGHSVCPLRL